MFKFCFQLKVVKNCKIAERKQIFVLSLSTLFHHLMCDSCKNNQKHIFIIFFGRNLILFFLSNLLVNGCGVGSLRGDRVHGAVGGFVFGSKIPPQIPIHHPSMGDCRYWVFLSTTLGTCPFSGWYFDVVWKEETRRSYWLWERSCFRRCPPHLLQVSAIEFFFLSKKISHWLHDVRNFRCWRKWPFIAWPCWDPLTFSHLPSCSLAHYYFQMVQSSKVVIATAGPFLLHGLPLVDACVRYGRFEIHSRFLLSPLFSPRIYPSLLPQVVCVYLRLSLTPSQRLCWHHRRNSFCPANYRSLSWERWQVCVTIYVLYGALSHACERGFALTVNNCAFECERVCSFMCPKHRAAASTLCQCAALIQSHRIWARTRRLLNYTGSLLHSSLTIKTLKWFPCRRYGVGCRRVRCFTQFNGSLRCTSCIRFLFFYDWLIRSGGTVSTGILLDGSPTLKEQVWYSLVRWDEESWLYGQVSKSVSFKPSRAQM